MRRDKSEMKEKKNKMYIGQNIRKSWSISPVEKAHSTKKGKRGYNRKALKKNDMRDTD